MRIIDADELRDQIDEWLDCVGTALVGKGLSYYGELLGCIDDCKTVDPVKHEYWIGYDTTTYTGQDDFGEPIFSPRRFYRCHGCRTGTVVKTNYCPKCGSKMDLKGA